MDEFVANESCHNYTNGVTSLQKRNLRSNEGNEENSSNNAVTCSVADKSHAGNEDGNKEGNEKTNMDVDYNSIRLLTLKEAPGHLAFNRNIHRGYRSCLTASQCVDSIFWLTNETVNIWSHLFGCFLFFGMLMYDLCLLNFHASLTDKLIVGGLLLCFQGCMLTSVLYHTFNCQSEKHYHRWLKYDLYGISFSLLGIYMSGIYYAFWCNPNWCLFYSITVAAIFIAAMVIQVISPNERLRVGIFVFWAAYGILPTIHWTFTMGGWDNPIVQKLLPRVINMYCISGLAFFFYISYIPERFFPAYSCYVYSFWLSTVDDDTTVIRLGKFDFIGSSHQAWHVLIVYALYYWHNTGISYIEYRMNHSCFPY